MDGTGMIFSPITSFMSVSFSQFIPNAAMKGACRSTSPRGFFNADGLPLKIIEYWSVMKKIKKCQRVITSNVFRIGIFFPFPWGQIIAISKRITYAVTQSS